jgi:hypothetical protein
MEFIFGYVVPLVEEDEEIKVGLGIGACAGLELGECEGMLLHVFELRVGRHFIRYNE